MTMLSRPGQPNDAQFSPLHPDDVARYELQEPTFGDYPAFLDKINAILQQRGAPAALRALSAHWSH